MSNTGLCSRVCPFNLSAFVEVVLEIEPQTSYLFMQATYRLPPFFWEQSEQVSNLPSLFTHIATERVDQVLSQTGFFSAKGDAARSLSKRFHQPGDCQTSNRKCLSQLDLQTIAGARKLLGKPNLLAVSPVHSMS